MPASPAASSDNKRAQNGISRSNANTGDRRRGPQDHENPEQIGAGGGDRTHTPLSGPRILSLLKRPGYSANLRHLSRVATVAMGVDGAGGGNRTARPFQDPGF